jgi:hypothetical protein
MTSHTMRSEVFGIRRSEPSAAYFALVWLLVALLSAPLATLAGRSMPRTAAGLPVGQIPNQSEEESESWPKTEVRHATPASGSGGPRGRHTGGYRIALPRFDGLMTAGRGLRPRGHSELVHRNGTGGPLRC